MFFDAVRSSASRSPVHINRDQKHFPEGLTACLSIHNLERFQDDENRGMKVLRRIHQFFPQRITQCSIVTTDPTRTSCSFPALSQ